MKIRTFSKVLSLLLALVLLASVFAACDATPTPGPQGENGADGINGADGQTPYIKNGYWWIGDQSTGVKAEGSTGSQGIQGERGEQGLQGVGIQSAYIDPDTGHLILLLSDGTEIDAGFVAGATTYIVTFNLNGDTSQTAPAAQSVAPGGVATSPTIQLREGYELTGWYLDAACTQRFDFSTPINGNLTLYAGWMQANAYDQTVQRKQEELNSLRELNNGTLPEILLSNDSYAPSFILGTYTSETVSGFESAVSSLSAVQNIMGISNPQQEYTDAGTTTLMDNTTQYRMQQNYNGYPVYGQQLIVTTNQNGTVTSLSGDHAEINATFDDTINVSLQQATQFAVDAGYGPISDGDGQLMAYTQDGYNEMVYVFNQGVYTVIVSANDGNILKAFTNFNGALPSEPGLWESTMGRQESTDTDTFNTIWFDYENEGLTDTFIFYDAQRNVLYHDGQMQTDPETNSWEEYYSLSPLQDGDNIWTSEADDKAVELYKNLSITYDFYLNVLGLASFNGNNGLIIAVINDNYDNGNNAFSAANASIAFLGFGGSANYQNNIDIVAHEFTHAIQNDLVVGIDYNGQTGALMEAYADVMGELIQLRATGSTDWVNNRRNLADPRSLTDSLLELLGLDLAHPEKLNGAGYYTGTEDHGGVHHNSTVVSHAIYTMYQSGLNDIDELTELLYRAWSYLKPTASFFDYRMAMLAAAADMSFNAEKIAYITSAFDAANIQVESYDEGIFTSVNANCTVTAPDGVTPVPNANILVELLDDQGTDVANVTCDENGVYNINLGAGTYRFTVSATGYETVTGIYSFEPFSDYQLSFVLGRESSRPDEVVCEIAGIITDALTGSVLPNVTLTFRKGYNVTSGRSDLVLTTNEQGYYATTELESGFYTMEMSLDGYITAYQTVQVAASTWDEALIESAKNQSFSISPFIDADDTLRIVLSWGESPNDLDSHIWGHNSAGDAFHVYYSIRNAYDVNSEDIANLDIDDTTSYGPETITIHFADLTQPYRYYIHDYSNKSSSSSTAMSNSDAKVSVFSGSTLLAVYDIPVNQPGTVWHVFDFDPVTGSLITFNEFSFESNASLVGVQTQPVEPETDPVEVVTESIE